MRFSRELEGAIYMAGFDPAEIVEAIWTHSPGRAPTLYVRMRPNAQLVNIEIRAVP